MVDTIDATRRSWNMSRIASKNTSPELYLRTALHRSGFRFRLHRGDLPGKPDLVLPRFRTAVFVHGCFWHGHACSRGKLPSSNESFWVRKITANVRRDHANVDALRGLGWSVVTIWECELDRDLPK